MAALPGRMEVTVVFEHYLRSVNYLVVYNIEFIIQFVQESCPAQCHLCTLEQLGGQRLLKCDCRLSKFTFTWFQHLLGPWCLQRFSGHWSWSLAVEPQEPKGLNPAALPRSDQGQPGVDKLIQFEIDSYILYNFELEKYKPGEGDCDLPGAPDGTRAIEVTLA
ncbi:hypothetical protein WISP_137390 [Willisornis vidua]|uniref:Uncharacterized protein n=1 Tax=Willisornis vidua TaxID=1566151 RepID=A0ABQ9CN63_9PASS|nr:hypothetical protein WISP_145760 [Willisornis vidua]KAJ7405888.1 hypothetical protein WISP_137390 [Willisornis vidua]